MSEEEKKPEPEKTETQQEAAAPEEAAAAPQEAAAPAEEQKQPKEKKPIKPLPPKRATPLKRDIQNEKKYARNRAFKSRIRTATNAFEKALKEDKNEATTALSTVFSLMDKGVKRGIVKLGKAKRQKSRLHSRLNHKS